MIRSSNNKILSRANIVKISVWNDKVELSNVICVGDCSMRWMNEQKKRLGSDMYVKSAPEVVKYADGSVWTGERVSCRGGCLPVRASDELEVWRRRVWEWDKWDNG